MKKKTRSIVFERRDDYRRDDNSAQLHERYRCRSATELTHLLSARFVIHRTVIVKQKRIKRTRVDDLDLRANHCGRDRRRRLAVRVFLRAFSKRNGTRGDDARLPRRSTSVAPAKPSRRRVDRTKSLLLRELLCTTSGSRKRIEHLNRDDEIVPRKK